MEQCIQRGSRLEQSVQRGSRLEQSVPGGSRLEQSVQRGSRLEQSVQGGSRLEQSVQRGSRLEQSRTGRESVLAVRVLEACRNQLFFRQRYLEQALFRLRWAETEDIFLGNDGEYLYYDRKYILKRYAESPVQMSMDYLHTVMHCLYQHPFFCPRNCTEEQELCWDLAADIAVECVLEEMREPGALEIPDTASERRCGILQKLKAELGFMSVQKLFSYLQNISAQGQMERIFGLDFQELCRLFQRDSHRLWHTDRGNTKGNTRGESSTGEDENSETPDGKAEQELSGTEKKENSRQQEEENSRQQEEENSRQQEEENSRQQEEENSRQQEGENSQQQEEENSRKQEEENGQQQAKGNSQQQKKENSQQQAKENSQQQKEENSQQQKEENSQQQKKENHLQQIWKNVAERVLVEAQAFAHSGRGEIAGDMLQHLKKLTRETYDYTRFLTKFATHWEERMQIDEDEFDYAFYTYGLKLFGKVPLIEPLEYREKNLIREFLIAIDTSGSCQGEVVERFLTKTYNILRQTQAFTARVNIHIVQCDARIQEDARIETQEELEAYIAHLTLKGFGGTDFTPVFEYADRLLESGEIRHLDGLLYFTDGYGIFPARPPGYRTAFVFLDKEEEVRVPPWAMKVYLD